MPWHRLLSLELDKFPEDLIEAGECIWSTASQKNYLKYNYQLATERYGLV